jgi:hypothetical protein
MLTVYYRYHGDTEPDDPADMNSFLMPAVPSAGEYVAVSWADAYEVKGVAWFPSREYHSKARVPVLILEPNPL